MSGDGRHDTTTIQRMLAALGGSAAASRVLAVGPARLGVLLDGPSTVSTAPPVTLTWAGRLDNAGEIASLVGLRPTDPDAALVGAAVARGEAGVRACLGDFALAAWWPAERRLVLARDAMGIRPLYYASTPDVFWWASSLAGIMAAGWLAGDLNEEYFAEYLADAPATVTETPVRGALRLAAGTMLELREGVTRAVTYWSPDAVDERPISEGEAIDALRHLFGEAVRVRLRSEHPVGFELSGGLDSTAVVGMACAQGATHPRTYSLSFPERPRADETPYARAVANFHGCRATFVESRPMPPTGFSIFDSAIAHGDLPEISTGEFLFGPMLRRAADDGCRILLSGVGGDDFLTGSLWHATDLLRHGHVWSAWRHIRDYRAVAYLDDGAYASLRYVLAPLIPRLVKHGIRRVRPAIKAPWLRPEFMARTQVRDRLDDVFRRIPETRSQVVRESLVRLASGDRAHLREAMHRSAVNAGLELRHPFMDRRLVEFLITLPDAWRFRQGQHRYLMRRALSHQWPPEVAARVDKPDFEMLRLDALRAADPDRSLEEPLQVIERGWVDRAYLRAMWPAIQRASRHPAVRVDPQVHVLWQILAVEAATRGLSWPRAHVPAV